MAKAKSIDELLNDSNAMAEKEAELLESAKSTVSLSLKQMLQIEAFRVMLSDAKDRGITVPGLLMRKREQVQACIEDCIRFSIAVGQTFDNMKE